MIATKDLVSGARARDDMVEASQIPAVTREEASVLAREEVARFLTLVESLSGDDWEQPTDCTLWTVRDILAHQAGAYASYASLREFLRQMSAKPGPGQEQIDAINARQLADREGRGPATLIGELRRVGNAAVRWRKRLSLVLGWIPVPIGPPLDTAPLSYLVNVIYPRDTWSHRLDICRATDRPFPQTGDHDRRMVALVMRDLSEQLAPHLNGQSVVFDLTGAAGGRYRIGPPVAPTAIIKMDVLEFNRLASARLPAGEAWAQGMVSISGDRAFAEQILDRTYVLY